MFPVSGAPVSGLAGVPAGVTISETLSETLELSVQLGAISAVALTDALGLGDAAESDIISVLNERITLTGTPLPSMDFRATLTDGVRYKEALSLGWMLSLQEQITLDGATEAQRHVLAAIADVLLATGTVNASFDARTVLTSAIAIGELLASGWKEETMDTVEFQDALQERLNAVAKLVDAAVLTDAATPAMRLTAICADEVSLGDALFPQSDVFERLQDQVLFHTVIRLGDAEYVGWTLNGGASTEYRNYPFNGMVEFDGRYFGTSSSGLYELTGTDDAGEPIEWSIKTAVMDFLTGKLKRVPDCYIAFAGGDSVVLKVITEEDGQQVESIYTAAVGEGGALHNDRIKIGRGLSARYWQFELAGTGQFELDELAWRPLVLDRRLY